MTACDSVAPTSDAQVSGDRSWVSIAVEDDGLGIASSEVETLFEPFTQGKAGRAWRGPGGVTGSGLGLAISRRLARRMGGDITLRSTEGEGSRFTLWLPAADRQER